MLRGPRIFLAGAMISRTSGHGGFRTRSEVPRPSNQIFGFEASGISLLADGEAEALRRPCEDDSGRGVTSTHHPIDSIQFTEAELRAGVQAATDWGAYVMTHVYVPAGIRRAVRAGVRSMEHGQLAEEQSFGRMKAAAAVDPAPVFRRRPRGPERMRNRYDAMLIHQPVDV